MKKTKIIYWVFTILMVGFLGFGSIFDAISSPEAVDHVTKIGYPAYIVPFLGVAKILGLIAILIPGFPRVKEWAYAGLMFDILGACYSHLAYGDGPDVYLMFIIPVIIISGSYIFYHKLNQEEKTSFSGKVSLAGN